MLGQMAQFAPEVLDKISTDKTADEIWAITGAPVKVLRDDDEIKQIRDGRAQASQQQQQMMQMQVGAQVAKDAGSAEKSMAEAKK